MLFALTDGFMKLGIDDCLLVEGLSLAEELISAGSCVSVLAGGWPDGLAVAGEMVGLPEEWLLGLLVGPRLFDTGRLVVQRQQRLVVDEEQMLQEFRRLEIQGQQRLVVEEEQMLLEFGRLEFLQEKGPDK